MQLPSQNCAHRHLDWGWRFGISLHMIDDSGWIVMLWLLIVSFSYALVGQYSASLGHLYGANAGYSNLIIRYVTLIKLWFPSTGHWRDFKESLSVSHIAQAGGRPCAWISYATWRFPFSIYWMPVGRPICMDQLLRLSYLRSSCT